jgi:molybdopterin-containing oxidoreductase family membrane subunit
MATEQLTYKDVNRDILGILGKPSPGYLALLGFTIALVGLGAFAWGTQINQGMGVAGINHPIFWGVYITNFVFWVGIAHSGTLISAILFLFRARWRTAIFRTAEAMTVIAVMTAGLYPLIHLGRAWRFYWLFPYPNERELWVNFRSPLIWDVLAVMTYFIVSSMFLYVGMLPDISAAGDASSGWKRSIYKFLSLGWRGTVRQWKHFNAAYLFLAALATPLVVSVHSIVSWDFAMSIVPGWHSTIFAPYFVAGAIHSGLAMVIMLLIPFRKIYRLERYITIDHFENLAKLIVLTGFIMGYAYATEFLVAWYSANVFEQSIFFYRALGDYATAFWIMIVFNSLLPLTFLIRAVRTNVATLLVVSVLINVGMWFERFVIIVGSLSHEFLPYDWGLYRWTWVEISISVGSLAWFFMWLLLFFKCFPAVAIAEVKEALPRHVQES